MVIDPVEAIEISSHFETFGCPPAMCRFPPAPRAPARLAARAQLTITYWRQFGANGADLLTGS